MKNIWLLICLGVTMLIANSQCRSDWTYSAIGDWPKISKFCASHLRQSPINIDTTTTFLHPNLKPINIVSKNPKIDVTVKNTGHSLKVEMPAQHDYYVQLQAGQSRYKVLQFHFHWGSADNKGSEHTLDNEAFPLEGHIVCFDSDNYNSSDSQLVYKANSLYVLGFFYEIGDEANAQLDAILMEPVPNKDDQTKASVNILEMFPTNIESYFRYWGSLTTPPCTETVLWTVAKTPLKVTKAQMLKFRNMKYTDGSPLVNNFRPVQPLNSDRSDVVPRIVYFSKASNMIAASNWLHYISFLALWIYHDLF